MRVTVDVGECNFNSGNTFTVEISDPEGDFSGGNLRAGFPKMTNAVAGVGDGTYTFTLPTDLPYGTAYRIRVAGSNPSGVPVSPLNLGSLLNPSGNITILPPPFRTNPPSGVTTDPPATGTLCQGADYELFFPLPDTVYNAGNNFLVQIGTLDGSGNFMPVMEGPTPKVLGTFRNFTAFSGDDVTIRVVIPYDLPASGPYYIRYVTTSPYTESCVRGPYTVPRIRSVFTDPVNQLICSGTATFSVGNQPMSSSINWQSICFTAPSSPNGYFNMVTTGLATLSVNDIARSGNRVYAATSDGLSRADNWAVNPTFNLSTSLTGNLIRSVFVSGSNVYAASGSNGLFISNDGLVGASFTNITTAAPHLLSTNSLNKVVVSGGVVYVASVNGLERSGGPGGEYVDIITGVPVNDVFVDGSYVYAATANGVMVSPDGGNNFITYNLPTNTTGLPSNSVLSIYVLDNIIYVGTDIGFAYSVNGGLNFTTVTAGLTSNSINRIFVDANGRIYGATQTGLVMANESLTGFTNVLAGLFNTYVTGINLSGNELLLSTLQGVARATVTTGASSSSITANAANSLCRYQAVISLDGCSITSNMVRIADIPPDIMEQASINLTGASSSGTTVTVANTAGLSAGMPVSVTAGTGAFVPNTTVATVLNATQFTVNVAPTTALSGATVTALTTHGPQVCGGNTGRITVKGLIPQTKYRLNFTGPVPGSPKNGDTITADGNGQFSVNFLTAGAYTVSVTSLVVLPGQAAACSSNTVNVALSDPTAPADPVPPMTVAPVCEGSNVTITLQAPANSASEEYRWYNNMGAVPPALFDANPNDQTFTPQTPPAGTGMQSFWVVRRNNLTQCSSDTIQVNYTINAKPAITCTPNSGNMSISIGLTNPGTGTYELSYVNASNMLVTVPGLTAASFPYTLGPGLPVGNYSNIFVVETTGIAPNELPCTSNVIGSCPLFGEPDPEAIAANALQTTVCNIPGVAGGFYQDVIMPSNVSDDYVAGMEIAVGRIRQTKEVNPSAADLQEKVEMRGWVRFNLDGYIPPHARIDRVEFLPKSTTGGFRNVGNVPVIGQPATGDIQFDLTQIAQANYPLPAGYLQSAFDDLKDDKYNDFTISNNVTGALTDLGPQGAIDVQSRLRQASAANRFFQLGIALSGSDFDIPVLQFHGIVFDEALEQKLCITYHLEDFGDLPEPKYATDLAGGLVGPSHRVDLIDIDTRPTVTTLNPALYIGATPPDAEIDGQQDANAAGDDTNGDDEDLDPATAFAAPLIAGTSTAITVPVTNFLTRAAAVTVFIDWNNDGVFNNTDERFTAPVSAAAVPNPAGPVAPFVNSTLSIPVVVPTYVQTATVGVRVRITSAGVVDAYGPAPDGEVEDFLVEVRGLDFGDLPDPANGIATNDFRTRFADNGARHAIVLAAPIYLGATVDAEADGQASANADGDDLNPVPSVDDEDGVVFLTSPMVPGRPVTIEVSARNGHPTLPATLYLYADFNNDGISSLLPVTLNGASVVFPAAMADTVIRTYTFDMPLNAAYIGDKAFFRFRFTTQALANDATGAYGLAQDGEVEDYISGDISLYDWADLPEPRFFTDKAGGTPGPSHRIAAIPAGGGVYVNPLFIGATPADMEPDGLPSANADGDDNLDDDDEDIAFTNTYFTNPLTGDSLIAGNSITLTVPYTNITSGPANMLVFIDWNGDGDFEDDGERIGTAGNAGVTPPTGSQLVFNIPIPATASAFFTGVRIRLTTGAIFDANGPAPDGEVEDLFVNVYGFDYGDLPDNDLADAPSLPFTEKGDFQTIYTIDGTRGPRHRINPDLKIGNTVDAEGNGQPQLNAFGDDIVGIDDEDGVIQPDSVVRGKPATFKVFVTNKTLAPAYLYGFADWNDDGDFLDVAPGENERVGPIVIPAGASGYYLVTFIVPQLPNPLPPRVGARFRLSSTDYNLSTGPAQGLATDIDGEVEDIYVDVVGYDWGDLPEPRYITDALGGQQGPSHKIATTDDPLNPGTRTWALYIGATQPDPEPDGQPHPQAFGDDNNPFPNDDEDLSSANFVNKATGVQDSIVAGEPITLRVPVVNNYADSTATLWAFIDWNGDGIFTGPEETKFIRVAPTGGVLTSFDFDYIVPAITKPDSIGVRVRFTSGKITDAYGIAPDGEVEDFIVEVKSRDFGDLPDVTANVGKDDFQTLKANEGPRHAIPVVPLVYLGEKIDTEADGQPSGNGDGDDNNPLQQDDEDGIIFLTPMQPGNTAQLAFYATNNSPDLARLHIWADWDNDGTLDPVTVVNAGDLDLSPTPPNNVIPVNAKRIITFQVPANATLDGGKIHFRFRISSHPAFLAAPSPLGLAQNGEVEDYVVPLFKVGNLVWEDRNNNGFQDAEEINLGIENVRVVLRFGGIDPTTGVCDSVTQNTIADLNTLVRDPRAGDQITDYVIETYTNAQGQYIFTGMIEGFYQVIAADTFGLTPTRFDWIRNVTEEDRDSDGKPYKNPWEYVLGDRRQSKSQEWKLTAATVGTDEEGILDQRNPHLPDPNEHGDPFPDNRVEQRIDFGYVGYDFGDLAQTGNNPSVTNFNTEEDGIGLRPEGPKHIVTPDLRLGRCQDVEWEGQSDPDAGADFKPVPVILGGGDDPVADFSGYPGAPHDPSQGRRWPFHDAANACGDDEDGIRFNTPLVAGYDAQISVRYNAKLNLDGPDAYLHAWFDWNGDGDFYVNGDPAQGIDPNEHIIFTALDGGPISLEPNTKAVELEMSYLSSPDDSIRLTFRVPSDVAYNNGNMLTRFRISFDPRLGPDGILDASINFPNALGLNFPATHPGAGTSTVPGGVVPYGEVEDYFISLSKVGNLVWEDRDYDGIQDALEPPIANVPVRLEFAGVDGIFGSGDPYEYVYHDTTDANGIYYFCGLIGNVDPSGVPNPTYRLIVSDPAGMTATYNNPDPSDDNCIANNSNGDDELIDGDMLTLGGVTKFERVTMDTFTILNPMMLCEDEDGKYDVGLLGNPPAALPGYPGSPLPPSPDALNNFPDNQYDETRDFGYVGFDYGDLPITSVKAGSNYPTLRDSMDGQFSGKFGARHAIQPRLYLGKGVDAELNGQPDDDAGSKAGGDDDNQGAFVKGANGDDESGVLLLSPLLPGERAYIKVNYTAQDTTPGSYINLIPGAYLDAFVDWNGNGVFDMPGEKLQFTHQRNSGATFNTNNVPPIAGGPVYTATLPATGATGVDSTILAFDVPNDAVFDSGVVYMRFRLGKTNYGASYPNAFPVYGLGPDNNAFHMAESPFVKSTEPFNDVAGDAGRYPYPVGEVEDYGIPVAKIGNLAWYDHDVFGDQDAGEEGVDSLHLVLVWGGIDPATGEPDTVGYQTSLQSLGSITDILYNRTVLPSETFPANTPGYPIGGIKKTGVNTENTASGLYSFRGLIPGRYYVIPEKYLQRDSASFVDFWPKHRVLTLQDNPGVDDNNDSDGIDITGATAGQISRGPGAFVRINDGNAKYPEVCVNDRPLKENGLFDGQDTTSLLTRAYFPDNQWDQSVDFGWIDEPNIEANLDIVGVDFPTSQTCYNFNVIMHLCVKNPTEVPLDSLMMMLNLKEAYGDAFVGNVEVSIVDSAFTVDSGNTKVKKTMAGSVAALTPFLNPNYNGDTDTQLFMTVGAGGQTWNDASGPGAFYLPGDSVVCVRIEFEIDGEKDATFNANTPNGWYSQATVWARAVGFRKDNGQKRPVLDFRFFDPANPANPNPRFGQPIQVNDLSDEFDDPMPMAGLNYPDGGDGILFEGMVADRGENGEYKNFPIPPSVTGRDKYLDENDKTIQNDECWIRTRWNGGVKDINISMGDNCETIIYANMLVPNHIDACGFDKYPEGSYYRVIIQDAHTEETLWASVDRVPFYAKNYLGRKLIYKVRSVANHCHPIWGKLNLEDKTKPVVTCPLDGATVNRRVRPDSKGFVNPDGVLPFICTDVDSILRVERSWLDPTYPYYTGIATAVDACGEVYLDKVSDELQILADCMASASNGYITARIVRTFFFRDSYGNETTCTQWITFRKPQILLPECKVDVANNLAAGDNLLLPADLIGKYNQREAVPYFINAAGRRIYLTEREYCGFAVSYTDREEYEIGLCGKKIIRRWSITDWCYGMGSNYPDYLVIPSVDGDCYPAKDWVNKQYHWEQLIVVGDDNPPIVVVPDIDKDGFKGNGYRATAPNFPENPRTQTTTYDPGDIYEFSTGPMDCTGAFIFTKDMIEVIEQSDWCFDLTVLVRRPVLDLDERPVPGRFTMKPDAAVRVTGDCQKGYTITGVPMPRDTNTFWFLQLRVYDACYRETIVLVPFRIADKIAPVMKCDDVTNITFDNFGVAHITAVAVDEGSWDNCGKVVWKKVRRQVSTGEDCVKKWLDLRNFVDVNRNGRIDANIDYIDEDRNFRPTELEYFRLSESTGALMSPMLDSVPLFCCDGDSVMIELWGEDKVGNRSHCWKWVILEDKTTLDYIMPWPQTITCRQEREKVDLLRKAGTFAEGSPEYAAAVSLLKGFDIMITSGGFCSPVTKEIVINPQLHCDAGEILISWKLTKAGSKGDIVINTPVIKLTVKPVHEYNIRFPADLSGNCTNLLDTANVIDGGELACDVLAVFVQDKRYNTSMLNGDPADACYKVFRTFTVVNWCQYDEKCGEPMQFAVVVPRDPRNNGFNGVNVLVRDPDAATDGAMVYRYEDNTGTVAYPNDAVNRANNGNLVVNTSDDIAAANITGANMCQFGDGAFAWMFTQQIFVHDTEPPVVEDPGKLTFYTDKNTCTSNVSITIKATDNCGATEIQQSPAIVGNLAIERVRIRVDDGPVQELGTLGTISPAHALNGDDKGTNSWVFNGPALPQGNHTLIVIVRDDCGNPSTAREIQFTVADTTATPPICHHGLSTALMRNPTTGGGEMVVWATDFVASPIYDCNGQGPETDASGKKLITKYYVVKDNGDGVWDEQDGLDANGFPLEKKTNVTFDCNDLKLLQVNIRLYSEDAKGNMAYCETYALITDPNKVCGGGPASGSIAGAITTETKINVEGVEVNLSGERQMTFLTTANGQYSFGNIEQGYDYSVTPHLDKDYLNGVSTFDMVLITKHILGIQPLNSPYKLIAADINNSRSITTLDMIQLRKLILGIDGKYANNTSWRFVDAAFKFDDPSNPWKTPIPEVANINDLAGDVTANFVAIKIGDVNGNALANSIVRTAGAFTLKADDLRMKAGNEYRIPFSGDLSAIEGYQFTLGFDRELVELVDIEYGVAKAENFGIFAREGLITTSWNEAQGAGRKAQGETLFTLVLRAKADVASLHEALNVNSRITRAEAYRADGTYLEPVLAIASSTPLRHFALEQNIPNPFLGETMIGFWLPEAGEATLTIQDVTGRTLRVVRGDFAQGYNQVPLKSSDLNATGVLYYTLKSGEHVATKKMIILE